MLGGCPSFINLASVARGPWARHTLQALSTHKCLVCRCEKTAGRKRAFADRGGGPTRRGQRRARALGERGRYGCCGAGLGARRADAGGPARCVRWRVRGSAPRSRLCPGGRSDSRERRCAKSLRRWRLSRAGDGARTRDIQHGRLGWCSPPAPRRCATTPGCPHGATRGRRARRCAPSTLPDGATGNRRPTKRNSELLSGMPLPPSAERGKAPDD